MELFMNKPRGFFKDTYHHLYNRGANKLNLFLEEENYLYFLRRIKFYKEKYSVQILAYCLMPNHFHLFVKQTTEEFLISVFISSLLNSYTKSFNKRFPHSGTLFEAKTKSKPIEDEHYFIWIIKYILENPVKAGLVKTIDEWQYSNAKDLLGLRNGTITDVNEVASFFPSKNEMIKFICDYSIAVEYEF
jgi:putative transposase